MNGNSISITDKSGVAVVKGDRLLLTDVPSALDLIGNVSYQTGSSQIVLFQENIAEDFFILSTGKLGEVLQKFVTYRIHLAIVGDFSVYNSKPLHDFIYESNQGKHIFFATDEQAAVQKLSKE